MTAETAIPFGGNDHDSLQYHLFCGDVVCGARIFRTRTLDHSSAWIYDGRELREVFNSSERLTARDARGETMEGEGVSFAPGRLAFSVGGGELVVRFEVRTELSWPDRISTVIHQPDLACEIAFEGQSLSGIGYCKRYTWTPIPHHWGYRFVQGFTSDHGTKLWTAEATFGESKYDYFNIIRPDGTRQIAGEQDSGHRQNAAFARIAGERITARLTKLGRWEAPLVSTGMDSLLRQRVCRLTLESAAGCESGLAINETCYGTLG